MYLLPIAGLTLNATGVLLLTVADLWFSRAILVYVDALEDNLLKLVRELQAGGKQFVITEIDLKRDRRQNLARSLKSLGWLVLFLGFVISIVDRYVD